jgi:capsular polysaccharide biosynthesis protein
MSDTLLRAITKSERRWPENIRDADIELFEDERVYSTRGTFLRHVGEGRVSPDSVVYKNGALVKETVVAEDQIPHYRLKHLVKKFLTGKRVRLDDKRRYLLVTDAWSAGHFHWFMEVLPKLWVIKDRAKEFVLLLPNAGYIKQIGLASLERLNLRFMDIVLMENSEFYRVRDLYYISRIAGPGQVDDQLMKELNEAFAGKNAGGNRRIYISRARARVRKVLNETELTTKLKENGFEIMFAEDLSLDAQIETFAQCSTLMGIHGAGLTNCVFMKPGGKVIELRKREKNYGYWHLADSQEHKYYYYHGTADSDASLIGSGSNLTVSVEDFEREILRTI